MTRDEEIAALRKRLAELEAQPPSASFAAAGAGLAPKPATVSRGPLIAGAIVLVLIALVAISAYQPKPEATPSDNLVDPAKVELSPSPPSVPKSPWVYSELDDPMATTKGHIVCTTSNNLVMLDFPYEPVSADLCIRRMPRTGLNVFVRLNGDGQILCTSYDGCSVLVRHDEAAPLRLRAVGPADNSSNTIFFNGEAKFLDRLKASKVTRVELNLYQAGQQTVEFDTAGLEWPPKGSDSATP